MSAAERDTIANMQAGAVVAVAGDLDGVPDRLVETLERIAAIQREFSIGAACSQRGDFSRPSFEGWVGRIDRQGNL